MTDVDKVASSLVTEAMEDAHLEVLRHLEAAYNVEPAADAVVLGETLLSGAHLFRSLVAGEAFQQRDVAWAVGGIPGRAQACLIVIDSGTGRGSSLENAGAVSRDPADGNGAGGE